MAPRPLEPARPGRSGKLTPFQHKLERLVRRFGVTGIARRTGLATSTISNWRKGTSPHLYPVQDLARGLDVDICWLTDDAQAVDEYSILEGEEETGAVREGMRKFLVAENRKSRRGKGNKS